MTLYADPSARACGLMVFDGDQPKVAEVFDLISKDKGTMPEICRIITERLTLLLMLYVKAYGIDKIVVEWPVGSQSARASWYLSAVQSTFMAFALTHGVEYIGIKENDIKKLMHGRAKKVDKAETIKFVIDNFPQFSYIAVGTKKNQEALADTFAVYYAHNKERLCPAKEEKVEAGNGEQEKVSKRKVRRRNNVSS